MISQLTGQLRRAEADRAFLECGAALLEILVPAFEAAPLRSMLGQEVTFQTILDLEGDVTRGGLTPRLIGFLRPADKRFFQLFTTVKGIGPKRALRTLAVPPGRIARAIEARDARFLIELPEIGKRLAELIVAELAGKMMEFVDGGPAVASTPRAAARPPEEQDAIDAAAALGLPRPDAERLLDRARLLDPPPTTADALLREMLRLRAR
jgi:Holliday junction DNA helicase RuvA